MPRADNNDTDGAESFVVSAIQTNYERDLSAHEMRIDAKNEGTAPSELNSMDELAL